MFHILLLFSQQLLFYITCYTHKKIYRGYKTNGIKQLIIQVPHMTGGGGSLFGFTSTSNIYVGSACFVIIVGYLVLAEHILTSLEQKFVSSGYREMIKSLYMELVIMGISSFVLSMILFSGNYNSEWILHLVCSCPICLNLLFIFLFLRQNSGNCRNHSLFRYNISRHFISRADDVCRCKYD